MPEANSDNFPAHGNHHGATAGVKIDLAFDLLTGAIISHSLQAATEQDKTIGKDLVAEVRQGGVILADGDTLEKRLRASRHDLIDLVVLAGEHASLPCGRRRKWPLPVVRNGGPRPVKVARSRARKG